jgi:hypothetical protein
MFELFLWKNVPVSWNEYTNSIQLSVGESFYKMCCFFLTHRKPLWDSHQFSFDLKTTDPGCVMDNKNHIKSGPTQQLFTSVLTWQHVSDSLAITRLISIYSFRRFFTLVSRTISFTVNPVKHNNNFFRVNSTTHFGLSDRPKTAVELTT